MEITNKRIADIIPYAANAKKHDKRQINNVAESIKQYGFVQPIVIDRDGVIVIGHCRALAAKKLGMQEVPCVCVDDLTPEQVNALRRLILIGDCLKSQKKLLRTKHQKLTRMQSRLQSWAIFGSWADGCTARNVVKSTLSVDKIDVR